MLKKQDKYYAATGYNRFAPLVDGLTKETLDTAKKKLEDKAIEVYGNDIKFDAPVITSNTSGELFMRITFYDGTYPYSMYTPIE